MKKTMTDVELARCFVQTGSISWSNPPNQWPQLNGLLTRMADKIEQLQQVVKDYCDHHQHCRQHWESEGSGPCNCGLDKLLDGGKNAV